jgi:hypothetical protein
MICLPVDSFRPLWPSPCRPTPHRRFGYVIFGEQ